MDEETYYVVKKRAVPEVLLKAVEVNHLLESDKFMTVQEATEKVGLSRSSYYKYKDDILPFHENNRGKTLTFMLQVEDKPGILSDVLKKLADGRANVLTIHQAIPAGGTASITISIEIRPETENTESLVHQIESVVGVHYLKILGCE